MATTNPTPVLKDDVLYLGDNGRCLCGQHSGASARYTGRDISGMEVMPVDAKVLQHCRDSSFLRCEHPGCDVRPPKGGAR